MSNLQIPDWLAPEARAALRRLHANLVRQASWDELYESSLIGAAGACWAYLRAARLVASAEPEHRQVLDEQLRVDELRRHARAILVDFAYREAGPTALYLVDDAGLDAVITRLCRLEDTLRWERPE
jgi:hypothetical protein